MAVPNDGPIKTNIFNKKRMRAQENGTDKCTGMIWGANSPSLRKNYAKKDSDVNVMNDFGKYMAEKQRKLRLQFHVDASDNIMSDLEAVDVNEPLCNSKIPTDVTVGAVHKRPTTRLFEGISIFVDGFTIPSHQELRELMIKHGGIFENYFRKDHVTHIICSTLPDSKIKDPRSFSRGLPIVQPAWVVDSIASGKVLPVSSYCLERLARDDPNQCTLSSFLALNKGATLDVLGLPEVEQNLQQEVKRENSGAVSDADVALDECESFQQPCLSQIQICGQDMDTQPQAAIHSKSSPYLREDLGSTHGTEDNKSGMSVMDGSVRAHCTLGDANFVQNYFKNSRLHFIGTWRTRYQKRYGCYRDKDGLQDQLSAEFSLSDPATRTILHVDMDCFFVSVVARNRPELTGKPVAVCHSENTQGTAEISSSNYAARKFGVKSGMFIRDAKALCSGLEVVPYDFEGYQQVADEFYEILHKHCNKVQAISCDEAYLDVTGVREPSQLASDIRKDIFIQTRCTASVGIAGNLLLARIATRKAKPDGLYYLDSEQVEGFLPSLSVEDLPGVGWALQEKLHTQGVYKCAQLLAISKEALQRDFGSKTGEMLWCYARGIDHRQVQSFQERKSIGAEVNWGVRFNSSKDAHHFLSTLCKEVSARLQEALVCGRTFTLKIKKRKEGAGEPHKFMGCGSCDNFSKSTTLSYATDNNDIIFRLSTQILSSFCLDAREIRGMGLQVTKLEPSSIAFGSRDHQQQKALDSWLHASSKDTVVQEASKVGDSLHGLKDEEVTKPDDWSMETMDNGTPSRDRMVQEAARVEDSLHGLKDGVVAKTVNPVVNSVSNDHAGIPWCVDKSQMKEEMGKRSLGRVLKGPFSGSKQISCKDKEKQKLTAVQLLPSLSELDCSVLSSLPSEILAEFNEAYNGALAQYMAESLKSIPQKHVALITDSRMISVGERNAIECVVPNNHQHPRQLNGRRDLQSEVVLEAAISYQEAEQSSSGRNSLDESKAAETRANLNQSIPASLSQVDMDTLKELPSQLQLEILKSLPVHRPNDMNNEIEKLEIHTSTICSPVEKIPELHDGSNLCSSECSRKFDILELADMWFGSPPKWVLLFKEWKDVGAELLQLLSMCYFRCRAPRNLSVILLELLPCLKESCLLKDIHIGYIDSVAFQCCLELFKQYLKIKLSSDLEEVFMALQILRRLAGENQFWAEICNIVIPFVQAMMGEYYGGMLSFH